MCRARERRKLSTILRIDNTSAKRVYQGGGEAEHEDSRDGLHDCSWVEEDVDRRQVENATTVQRDLNTGTVRTAFIVRTAIAVAVIAISISRDLLPSRPLTIAFYSSGRKLSSRFVFVQFTLIPKNCVIHRGWMHEDPSSLVTRPVPVFASYRSK